MDEFHPFVAYCSHPFNDPFVIWGNTIEELRDRITYMVTSCGGDGAFLLNHSWPIESAMKIVCPEDEADVWFIGKTSAATELLKTELPDAPDLHQVTDWLTDSIMDTKRWD